MMNTLIAMFMRRNILCTYRKNLFRDLFGQVCKITKENLCESHWMLLTSTAQLILFCLSVSMLASANQSQTNLLMKSNSLRKKNIDMKHRIFFCLLFFVFLSDHKNGYKCI